MSSMSEKNIMLYLNVILVVKIPEVTLAIEMGQFMRYIQIERGCHRGNNSRTTYS